MPLYEQVDDIETKLDSLIEMYKDDRQMFRLSGSTVHDGESALIHFGGEHETSTTKHLSSKGSSLCGRAPPSPVRARHLTHLDAVNHSDPTISLKVTDDDNDSKEGGSPLHSTARNLSGRFQQPPLVRNFSDLGPRVFDHQRALVEQCGRAADGNATTAEDHQSSGVIKLIGINNIKNAPRYDDVLELCDEAAAESDQSITISIIGTQLIDNGRRRSSGTMVLTGLDGQ